MRGISSDRPTLIRTSFGIQILIKFSRNSAKCLVSADLKTYSAAIIFMAATTECSNSKVVVVPVAPFSFLAPWEKHTRKGLRYLLIIGHGRCQKIVNLYCQN